MHEQLLESVITRITHLSGACETGCAVFDFTTREFVEGHHPDFCEKCAFRTQGKCGSLNTHQYGCFEAERWNGLYIYYCPMSLAFVATVVYSGNDSAYAMIMGPIVMGMAADVLSDNGGMMAEEILMLPSAPPERVTNIAQTQWAVAMFLSNRDAGHMEFTDEMKTNMLNTLYEITEQMQQTGDYAYPLGIERKLQQMIAHGDKEGAREMINQLLGHMYFNSGGNFEVIKQQALELVVLFSRASIEGGADIKQIFGVNRNILSEIHSFETLDELSSFLTSIFHRFVGYVFDFNQVKHVDIIHKVVDYIRENYMKKISLDDVARHVYLSKSYLSKIFKDEVNCSFTNFVNSIRVDKSKELLLDNGVSLADIATLVGFDDQSYFTKVFRKTTGVSPGQFRKSGGKAPSEGTAGRNK